MARGTSNAWVQGRVQKNQGYGVKKEWYKKFSNDLLNIVQIALCV